MSDDSSLTDFFDDEGDGDEATDRRDDEATAAETKDAEATDRPAGVVPADVTYEWSGETACDDCGEPTSGRWRDAREDENVFVCVDCKDW